MARLGLLTISAALCTCPVSAANLKGDPVTGAGRSFLHDGAQFMQAQESLGVAVQKKFMIASFPRFKTVAYTQLPDTVWRPLYLGSVTLPRGVATDPLNSRLFVADYAANKIFWYQLIVKDNGLLFTDGHQHVAVDNVTAYWMTVNGFGDLYFTGQKIVEAPASSYRSVYRMDEAKIKSGDPTNPVEVYTRSNSGYPNPTAWMPSGIAVDSFDIYWGNQEHGNLNGAVCSGQRQNIGVQVPVVETNVHTLAVPEVRGVALAGTNLFYLSPTAIYGMDKSPGQAEVDPRLGVIQVPPTVEGWDPKSIAYDGMGTMYWTDAQAGVINQFPAMDTNPHVVKKYVDAPQIWGLTIFAKSDSQASTNKLPANYGQRVSSAQAIDDSAAPATFHLHLVAAFLSIALPFMAC